MKKQNDMRAEAADPNYCFTAFKIWYDANKRHKQVGVIIESKSNELLFRNLLYSTCKFFPVEGWKNVESVVNQSIAHDIKYAIGIIDADFRRIKNETNSNEYLFWTDFHDTEIMCVYSPSWENLLNYYIVPDRLENFTHQTKTDILSYLMQIAKPLGILRLLNEQENLGLKFKNKKKDHTYDFIDYEDFIDKKTLKIDIPKMLKTVENKSMKPNFFKQNPDIAAQFKELLTKDFDLKELNNGHDILNILSVALQDAISSRKSSSKVSGAILEDDLIKIYRKEDFVDTQLYQDLQQWQNKHTGYQVLN